MKVKFVTCIYNNLYGTEYGGRDSRGEHYKYSLLSLLKIKQADFVLYTSKKESGNLSEFFYTTNNISKDKLSIKIFELRDSVYYNHISKIKNIEEVKKSDRCYEIQYNKFYWLNKELEDRYDYFYWIDAGLSHTGLFPPKHKIEDEISHRKFYNFSLFNDNYLNNLIKKTADKIYIIGKDNTGINYWSGTIPSKYYKEYDNSIHIIGGLFGGKKNKVKEYIDSFFELLKSIIEDKELYFEELLMSALYFNNKERFELAHFNIWWYNSNGPYPSDHNIYKENKSFYKLFEELQ